MEHQEHRNWQNCIRHLGISWLQETLIMYVVGKGRREGGRRSWHIVMCHRCTKGTCFFNANPCYPRPQSRNVAKNGSKWLMVNIQDAGTFACQLLNRDLWSDQEVKELVRENFIFLQVRIVSPFVRVWFTMQDVETLFSVLISIHNGSLTPPIITNSFTLTVPRAKSIPPTIH